MKAIYRTLSFWACIVMAFINVFILSVARQLHNMELQKLALVTMTACAVGAASHWYLDRLLSKKKR
jgi:membrane protein YqaA with SNARE-associated domain